MPISGNSSLRASVLSPNRSSMVRICPPGRVMRLGSSALSTERDQSPPAAGSRVTRWQVSVVMPGLYKLSRQAVYTFMMLSSGVMPSRSGPGIRRSQGRRDHDQGDQSGLREAILAATERLLAERPFADLAVSEILTAAGVSRGSFYFYFDSKHDVLAELVRRAVSRGHEAAGPWLAGPDDQTAALRAGITAGAELWRASAPVLRAIVENWRTDPRLTELWQGQRQTFSDAPRARGTPAPAPPP